MEQGTHSAVPIALGSASSDTEEGRAFFQDRLGLYAKWVFIFSGSFYALNLIEIPDVSLLLSGFSLSHLGATLTIGTLWAMTRSWVFSSRGLRWLDALGLVATCGIFAAMTGAMTRLHLALSTDPMQALLTGQLACSSTILTRAVAVPSTPARTFWLSTNTVHLTLLVISYASAEAACMAQESRRWRAHWPSCPKGPESLTT